MARKTKKDIGNILFLQTNGKYKVVKGKPAVGYDSLSISCFLSYLERTFPQCIPLYSHLDLY